MTKKARGAKVWQTITAKMGGARAISVQPRFTSSFLGYLPLRSTQPHPQLFRYRPGCNRVSMQFSRPLSGLTNLLFNSRKLDDLPNSKRKCLKPGKVSPPRPVPKHIPRPPYVESKMMPGIASGPEVHDEQGIERMRASGRLAAQVLQFAGTLVKPGIITDEIDEAVHQMIIDNGAYPSPLGYGNFPKSVCTSINECICHGIPDSRPLEDGDIINIDVTVYLNGYHGDTSATFFCGDVDDEARNLVQVTKECLDKAISICAPGVEFKKIGKTIHDHADKFHYGVVRQFVGHGVGRVFHADPVILHYRNNDGGRMMLNQTFTIEPMLTIGIIDPIMWNDDWTVVTEDGSLSAQFEHTILITSDGVLNYWKNALQRRSYFGSKEFIPEGQTAVMNVYSLYLESRGNKELSSFGSLLKGWVFGWVSLLILGLINLTLCCMIVLHA